jgi:hypothetical protein
MVWIRTVEGSDWSGKANAMTEFMYLNRTGSKGCNASVKTGQRQPTTKGRKSVWRRLRYVYSPDLTWLRPETNTSSPSPSAALATLAKEPQRYPGYFSFLYSRAARMHTLPQADLRPTLMGLASFND